MRGEGGGAILAVSHLSVAVAGRQVLRDFSLVVGRGEVHAISGINGSGKSTLVMMLVGSTQYTVSSAEATKILFDGKDLLAMTAPERARAGLYVAWQNPVAIPGVSVFALCKSALEARGQKIADVVAFKNSLEALAIRVGLSPAHIGRSVNDGFSGGERKRLELLQLLLLSPKLAILDELDSGLDEKGREMMVEAIHELRGAGTAFIVITHYNQLLERVAPDAIWTVQDGQLQTRVS